MAGESRSQLLSTAARQGGKAITASKKAGQLDLFAGTAESPRPKPFGAESGVVGGAVSGQPVSAPYAVPKPADVKGRDMPAMTMEEVASEVNLKRAWEKVASNNA